MGRLLASAAEGALDDALRGIGASAAGGHLTTPDGRELPLLVKAASIVTPGVARQLIRDRRRARGARIVVGDLVGAAARDVLRESGWGWLDRRGHLRLVAPGVWVDTEIAPMPRAAIRQPRSGSPIRGASGIAAAAAHLLWPDDPPGVRELARRVGLSGAAISNARRALMDSGLLSGTGVPAVPDLFWALVSAWRPDRVLMARLPKPTDDHILVATGTRAAVALDAPLFATGDYPVHLLAADERAFQRARLLGGETQGRPAATLALAPTSLVVHADTFGSTTVEGFLVVHPLFVALELAGDPGRGAEALEAWTPTGATRVW